MLDFGGINYFAVIVACLISVGVTLYLRRSCIFLWLNSAYFLAVMSVNSMILSVWR